MSAKLCCVAQACCLSTWVAQVGGSGASHKKACLTLKHFFGYLFTNAALFPDPSQALSCYCPQTPISSCHFLLQTLLPAPLQQGSPTVELVFLPHQDELILLSETLAPTHLPQLQCNVFPPLSHCPSHSHTPFWRSWFYPTLSKSAST